MEESDLGSPVPIMLFKAYSVDSRRIEEKSRFSFNSDKLIMAGLAFNRYKFSILMQMSNSLKNYCGRAWRKDGVALGRGVSRLSWFPTSETLSGNPVSGYGFRGVAPSRYSAPFSCPILGILTDRAQDALVLE